MMKLFILQLVLMMQLLAGGTIAQHEGSRYFLIYKVSASPFGSPSRK